MMCDGLRQIAILLIRSVFRGIRFPAHLLPRVTICDVGWAQNRAQLFVLSHNLLEISARRVKDRCGKHRSLVR